MPSLEEKEAYEPEDNNQPSMAKQVTVAEMMTACKVLSDYQEEALSLEEIILGNAKNLKKFFRQLSQKFHPDKNRDNKENAEAAFKRIRDAYETLTKAVDYFIAQEKIDEQEGTPFATRQLFLSDKTIKEYQESAGKTTKFFQELKKYREKIAISSNTTLITSFQDPIIIANIQRLYLNGWFDFEQLHKLSDEYFLKQDIDLTRARARADVFAVLRDSYCVQQYYLTLAFRSKKPLGNILENIQQFLKNEHLQECPTIASVQEETTRHFLARSSLTTLQKFYLFNFMGDDRKRKINSISPDDLKWQIICDVFKQHKEVCESFTESGQIISQGRWVLSKIRSIVDLISTDHYLTLVQSQILDKIEAQIQVKLAKKSFLEQQQKPSPKKIALVSGKIEQLRNAYTEVREAVSAKAKEALEGRYPTEITTQRFELDYKDGDHLQNTLEKILKKHADDSTVKKSRNPKKDFFRGLLGVVVAIPTFLLLVSSGYRNFIARTFFRTDTQNVFQESMRNCRIPADKINDIEVSLKTDQEKEKNIEAVMASYRPGGG